MNKSCDALDEQAHQVLSRYRNRAWLWVTGALVLFVLFVIVTNAKDPVILGVLLGIAWIVLQPLGFVGLLQVHKLRKVHRCQRWGRRSTGLLGWTLIMANLSAQYCPKRLPVCPNGLQQ